MAEIDKRIDDEVSAEEMGGSAIEANEQGTELVDPGESAFASEAFLVNIGVEEAFAATFVPFA